MPDFALRPPSKIRRNIFLSKLYHFDYSVTKTSDFWLGAQFNHDKGNDSPLIVFLLNRRLDIYNRIRFYTNTGLSFYNALYALLYRLAISNQIMAKIKKSIWIFFSVRRRFMPGDTLPPQSNIFSIPLQNYLESNVDASPYLVLQRLTKICFFIFPNIFETHKFKSEKLTIDSRALGNSAIPSSPLIWPFWFSIIVFAPNFCSNKALLSIETH